MNSSTEKLHSVEKMDRCEKVGKALVPLGETEKADYLRQKKKHYLLPSCIYMLAPPQIFSQP